MSSRIRRALVLVCVAFALITVSVFEMAATPWAANSFGYALAGDDGLPYRISFRGRHYHSWVTCSHADWCAADQQALSYCVPPDQLPNVASLVQVGIVPTFLGSAHGIYLSGAALADITVHPKKTMVSVFVEAYQGCYVKYGLMGGP